MLWSYWAILAIVLIVAEIFTVSFGLIWFGISALLAAGAAYLGLSLPVQGSLFAFGGILLLAVTRPLARRLHCAPEVQFGAKALIGKRGVVTKPIGEQSDPVGQIRIMGEDWRARADIPIPVGAVVEVVAIEGITLLVKPSDCRDVTNENQVERE